MGKKAAAKVIVIGACRAECCTSCRVHTAQIGTLHSDDAQKEIHIVSVGDPLPENMVDLDEKPIRPGKVSVSVNGRSRSCLVSNNGGSPKIYAEITEKDGRLVFGGITCEW